MNDNNHSFDPSSQPQPLSAPSAIIAGNNLHRHNASSTTSSRLLAEPESVPSMTMAATRKRSHPNPTTSNGKSSSADDGNETVERIIQAAESRDGSSRESSIATASSNNNNKMDTVEGGPFTNAELSQLSLLRVDGWNEVEGDTLLTLT
eukprot:scaffold63298_cov26-Cyclotella_meneghiniana.AAC.1